MLSKNRGIVHKGDSIPKIGEIPDYQYVFLHLLHLVSGFQKYCSRTKSKVSYAIKSNILFEFVLTAMQVNEHSVHYTFDVRSMCALMGAQ